MRPSSADDRAMMDVPGMYGVPTFLQEKVHTPYIHGRSTLDT